MAKPKIDIPATGGVNLLDDPRDIKDDEVINAKNLVPLKPGKLSKRPALAYISTVAGFSPQGNIFDSAIALPFLDGGFISMMHDLDTASGYDTQPGWGFLRVLDINGNQLNSTGSFTKAIGTERQPWMFVFGTTAYVLPGPNPELFADKPQIFPPLLTVTPDPAAVSQVTDQYRIQSGTRISLTALSGTGNENVRPKVGNTYRQRVVWGNFGGNYKRHLIMSDRYDPLTVGNDVLAANGRAFELPGLPGDEIIAIQEVMLNAVGSPAQSALLVLLRHGGYLITGELNEVGDSDPGDMVVNKISVDTGCISPWSVTPTPHGVLWASEDDVWVFDVGQVPRRVGTHIQPAIKRVGESYQRMVRAVYHEGFYRLQLPSEGQNLGLVEGASAPSIEYAGFTDEWWLELRRGAPADFEDAQWWGPQQFWSQVNTDYSAVARAPMWIRDLRPNQTQQLFGLQPGWNPGSGNLWSVVGLGAPGLKDILGPDGDVSQIADTPILFDLLSKEYDAKDPVHDKLIKGVNANIFVSTPATIHADVLLNGGDEVSAMEEDLEPYGFRTDGTALDAGEPGAKKPQAINWAPDPLTRPRGLTAQLHMYDEVRTTQSPITIEADVNDRFWFNYGNPAGGVGQYNEHHLFNLLPGTYTPTELAAELQRAWRTGVSTFGGETHEFDAFTVTFDESTGKFTWRMLGTDTETGLVGFTGATNSFFWDDITGFTVSVEDGVPVAPYVVSATDVACNRALMAIVMGAPDPDFWDFTDPDASGAYNTSRDAVDSVDQAAVVEFGGIELLLTVIPKDPL